MLSTSIKSILGPINHGVSMAFQLWLSSEVVGDAELATASRVNEHKSETS
jgi:hypothetical protein